MFIAPHVRPALVAEQSATTRRMLLAIAGALLLHVAVFCGLLLWPRGRDDVPAPPEQAVDMVFAPPPQAEPPPEEPQPPIEPPPQAEPPPPEPPPEPSPPAVEPPPEVQPAPPVPEPPPPAPEPALLSPQPTPPRVETIPAPQRQTPSPAKPTPPRAAKPQSASPPPVATIRPESPPATPQPVVQPRPVGGGQVPRPDYPESLRRRREQGRVVVSASVSPEGGAPASVAVVQSSGSPRLDELSLDAMRRARFMPMTIGGKPVSGTYTQAFDFRLEN